ncbi:MAG: alpha-galactosidase, partial [Candidatus Poribacteria bacterium]|nr:alpha-galactosidase [Candidatus Poribacteria bacterium]
IFGVRSGSPFIYTIPATGKRPMKFEAENLPEGLKLDPDTGHISGKIIKNGEYVVTLKAINELGKSVREFRIVCGDNICLTPAMGWSSWYVWARDVSEQHLLDTAKAMVESGLINHGWTYINIDDGWQGKRGGKFNAIQPNEKFTDMQSLCDYVHSLGLRIGIYSTPWITSYARYIGGSSNYEDGQWSSDESSMQGPPGGPNNSSLAENIWSTLAFKLKLDDANLDKAIPILQKAWDERKRLTEEADWGFQAMADGMAKLKPEIYKEIKSILTEEQFKALSELENSQEQPESNSPYGKFSFVKNDVNQWAEWGIDYFKYDWNPIDIPHSTEMGDALKACGRDIVYTLSNQASFEHASDWARIANSWRTTFDLSDNWQTISRIGFYQDKWATYAGPGHWNDPDMIMIGKVGTGRGLHPSGLTPDEQYAHFSLWCLLSAPLILGCDLTDLDDFTLNLITNDEVIDIDQDALGKQATRVMKSGDHEVWAKDLEDGSKAVGLFNLGDLAGKVTFIWSDINVNGKQIVRDLWRQKDIGTFDGNFEAEVPSHGVVLVKISPVKIK